VKEESKHSLGDFLGNHEITAMLRA